MMLSVRAVLLAVLAAGLLHIDAQAQMPDEVTLLPSKTNAVEAMPTEIGEPVPKKRQHREPTRGTGRDDDGTVLDSGGLTRREILDRLFAGREIEIEWRNKAFADERVQSGRLSGPPVEIARRLLARVSYVMSYESSSFEPRLARIVVFGSDPPSITRSAGAPPAARQVAPSVTRSAGAFARQEAQASEAERRRKAIDAARRAIIAAQRR